MSKLNELLALIEALELLTDTDDWHPTKKQWEHIKERINGLKGEVASPVTIPAPTTTTSPPHIPWQTNDREWQPPESFRSSIPPTVQSSPPNDPNSSTYASEFR